MLCARVIYAFVAFPLIGAMRLSRVLETAAAEITVAPATLPSFHVVDPFERPFSTLLAPPATEVFIAAFFAPPQITSRFAF